MTPEELRTALVRVGEAVRDDVLAACRAQSVDELAAYDDSGEGDTAFAVDRVSEQRLLELVDGLPVRLVAEGIATQTGDAEWVLLADPLDGTRQLAHQKRSAWVLLGATRAGRLQDLEVSVAVEVPTVKAGAADVLSAVRGRGATGERVDLRDGGRRSIPVRPSTATGIEQGYGGVARYFPGAREELAAIDDAVARRVLGPARAGKAQAFEDQYCTGGTLVELAVGHDRWACDLRPLLGTGRAGICAHPYDLAGWLVAAEAGVRVVAPDGSPLDAPLDLTSDVAWAAYANDAVRALVEPALQAVLVERGHLQVPRPGR
ncbi:MAG: inositol monophosphatase [Frankiales bacterium]|nr:inositol monophosphatase [Frankiales bacterium]